MPKRSALPARRSSLDAALEAAREHAPPRRDCPADVPLRRAPTFHARAPRRFPPARLPPAAASRRGLARCMALSTIRSEAGRFGVTDQDGDVHGAQRSSSSRKCLHAFLTCVARRRNIAPQWRRIAEQAAACHTNRRPGSWCHRCASTCDLRLLACTRSFVFLHPLPRSVAEMYAATSGQIKCRSSPSQCICKQLYRDSTLELEACVSAHQEY